MSPRRMLGWSVLIAAAMLALGWVAVARLPPGALLPTHWGPSGAVDRSQDARSAILPLPLIALALSVLFAALSALDPTRRIAQSPGLYRIAWLGALGVLGLAQAMIVAPAFGWRPTAAPLLLGIGLLLILIGNALPKSRPNFFIGIRTPWTLTDTDNWIATHRFGGKCFVAAGVAIGALGLAGGARAALAIGPIALAAALAPVVYSWWLWRKAGSPTRRIGE